MFSQLQDNLQDVFKKLRGQGRISEKNVADAMRDVRLALLEADVDYSVAKDFIATVREKALGQDVLRSITPGQQIIKIFHDALVELLGSGPAPLDLNPPGRILMAGLNGAGKTTTSAKLALRLKKDGRRPVLVACDLQRPAAIEQLATLAREIDLPVFTPEPGSSDVVEVARQALVWAAAREASVIIFDTAGRQEIDAPLVAELQSLRDFLQPREVLLVADSATGQQAVSVAARFHEAVGLTGIILTKLDGDARGGAALSMRAVTQQSIKFAGVGEKLDQLEVFDPDRMANRILGMGDIVGLVERAAEAIEEKEALQMAEKFRKASFDFEDFLAQMKMLRRLGPLEGLLGMIPGMSRLKDLPIDEKRLRRTEAIILSMTRQERRRPEIINGRRRQRIAKGSGTRVTEVNNLLRQFSEMRRMMKDKGKMKRLLNQVGGGMPPGMRF
ncbi:MAG TPA: signal recognition particle protein [Verrucomicrobiales bacterium]|nr:signal recognition particle protein [Verrucomicrobiales bacterium]